MLLFHNFPSLFVGIIAPQGTKVKFFTEPAGPLDIYIGILDS